VCVIYTYQVSTREFFAPLKYQCLTQARWTVENTVFVSFYNFYFLVYYIYSPLAKSVLFSSRCSHKVSHRARLSFPQVFTQSVTHFLLVLYCIILYCIGHTLYCVQQKCLGVFWFAFNERPLKYFRILKLYRKTKFQLYLFFSHTKIFKIIINIFSKYKIS